MTWVSETNLIAKYAEDLKNKMQDDPPTWTFFQRWSSAADRLFYGADSETVAASQSAEIELVKNNFLIKKLGLKDGPQLTSAINAVIETYGKSERNKYRAVIYYMLTKHFGKESVYK